MLLDAIVINAQYVIQLINRFFKIYFTFQPEHYGLSEEEEGCKACDCDLGGAYDNNCDVITGQCRCRPHVTGRRCDLPDQGYFAPYLDYIVYEAELAKASDPQVIKRQPFGDRVSTWTGLGFMKVFPGSTLEFDVTDVPESLDYDIVVRYEPQIAGKWEEAKVVVERLYPVDPRGPCNRTIPQNDVKTVSLTPAERYVVASNICLERGRPYKIRLEVNQFERPLDREIASILIDSVS